MAEMTKEKWISIGLMVAEHLEEIAKIAGKNNILVDLAAFEDGRAFANYIDGDGEDADYYGIDIRKDGVVGLEFNQEVYYTKA
ncbi:MAG: hypothetical protein ACLR71_13685 [[Clostridium] scindens]